MSALKVANAPCSWGVLEFELAGEAKNFQTVLDEMAQAGYAGTELGDWGFMPTTAKDLAKELKTRNLSMLAAFVPVDLSDANAHESGVREALKVAELLKEVSASPFIVLSDDNGRDEIRKKNAGRIKSGMELTDAQWKIFTEGAELVARTVLIETGVKTVFHHHGAGYVETPREIERFLANTDPLLIGLCLDTGHYTFGGGNALEALKQHSERIWHIHFKDLSQPLLEKSRQESWDYFKSVSAGIFCELGQGSVDFKSIIEFLLEVKYSGWIVVEQDVMPGMGSPFESARRNRAYLKTLGV